MNVLPSFFIFERGHKIENWNGDGNIHKQVRDEPKNRGSCQHVALLGCHYRDILLLTVHTLFLAIFVGKSCVVRLQLDSRKPIILVLWVHEIWAKKFLAGISRDSRVTRTDTVFLVVTPGSTAFTVKRIFHMEATDSYYQPGLI